MLREICRTYQDCPERVAKHTRYRWIATAASWILTFIAFLLSTTRILSNTLCMMMALLGGLVGGLSLVFASSAKRMPLFVRYTNLREKEIQQRLEELKVV